jgi:hypothetical protein
MKKLLPKIRLRELKMEDAHDHYKWYIDQEVTRQITTI